MRSRALALVLLVAACGRRTAFIGQPFADAVAPVERPPLARDGPPGTSPDASPVALPDASPDAPPAATCRADPPAAPVANPGWNCGPRCYRDDNVPADAPFVGPPDPGAEPKLAYPLPGSTHPINLTEVTLQWLRAPGGSQTAFHIRLTSLADPGRPYDLFIPCRPPPPIPTPPPDTECTYPVPRQAWAALAAENAGGEMEIVIDASDRARATVTSSAPVRIRFTAAAIPGGVYYFSDPGRGTMRGLPGAAAQPFISPGTTGNRFACGSCHAVSRDGRVIAFAAEQTGYLTAARTDDPGQPMITPGEPPQPNAATMSLTGDGRLLAISYGTGGNDGQLVVRETATGREVARLDPSVLGTPERKLYFPEWSPDGSELVATLASQAERPWSVNDGSLVVIPYNGGAFGGARVVVPGDATLFHFYPSWSPDGAWIAFVSAPLPGASYDNPRSRLRLVSRDGGPVRELGNATQEIGKATAAPRFLPFTQSDCQVYFLTFHSRIDYGFTVKNSGDATGGWPQLWLAAIDVRKFPGDPSSAPVWLPFQDPRHKNVLPVWVERLVCGPRSPCPDGTLCLSGECVAGN
jgi:WD40-like Beta Propeller Repeat